MSLDYLMPWLNSKAPGCKNELQMVIIPNSKEIEVVIDSWVPLFDIEIQVQVHSTLLKSDEHSCQINGVTHALSIL